MTAPMTDKLDLDALEAALKAALKLVDETTGECMVELPRNAWGEAVIALLVGAEALIAKAREVTKLTDERDAAIRELSAQGRATGKAEAERDALKAALEWIAHHQLYGVNGGRENACDPLSGGECVNHARAALNALAPQSPSAPA